MTRDEDLIGSPLWGETVKAGAIAAIERLPEDATVEDVLYDLNFREAIVVGLAQADRGEVISHEEVKRRTGRWLKSPGR